jgi:uncharacterized protein (TIGR03435 family)
MVKKLMADLAELLGHGFLDRPVVDQTGLTGKFDLRLTWTPDEVRRPNPKSGSEAASLVIRNRQQLV